MRIEYKELTKIGDRKDNEDTVLCCFEGNRYCFALADGLGGHKRGKDASALVVKAAADTLIGESYPSLRAGMESAFMTAQKNLIDEIEHNDIFRGMKSTLVLLSIEGENAFWAHIGDSRLYMFRNSKIVYQTKDHSVPQALVESGKIKPEKIRMHPDRNKLLRAMGSDWEGRQRFEMIENPVEIKKGDVFLMMSDGFWENVREGQMEKALKKSSNIELWLSKMENILLKSSKHIDIDNYSAIAVIIR